MIDDGDPPDLDGDGDSELLFKVMHNNDNIISLLRRKVRLWISTNKKVTFHSFNGSISGTPIDKNLETYKDNLSLALEQIKEKNPESQISEVGIVDKLYEERLVLELITQLPQIEINNQIQHAENKLISLRIHSIVVPDLCLVDMDSSFEPTSEQFEEASGHLNSCFPWFSKSGPKQQIKLLDQYLRYKYLPPVDIRKNGQLREQTISHLNKTLRFIRVETICYPSYVDLYVNAIGIKSLECNPDRKEATSTVAGGVFYLEMKDFEGGGVLNRNFITSSGSLLYNASKIPFPPNTSKDTANLAINKIRMMLSALLQNGSRFTGRIGIKKQVGDEIEWICSNARDPFLSLLASKLPANFPLKQHLTISDLEMDIDACEETEKYEQTIEDHDDCEKILADPDTIAEMDLIAKDVEREGWDYSRSEEEGWFYSDDDHIHECEYEDSDYGRINYDKSGYDKYGYDFDGYDKQGYDKEGFIIDSISKCGQGYYSENNGCVIDGEYLTDNDLFYNEFGYDVDGYDTEGYDRYGYDRNCFDKFGINEDGELRNDLDRYYHISLIHKKFYDYNRFGCNVYGYNKNGYNKHGFDKNGHDKDGYDENGYDKNGYDKYGYNNDGVNIFNYSKYDPNGYDICGYDKYGYDKYGYDEFDFDICGFDREGYNLEGFDRCGYDKSGYNIDGYDRSGFTRSGYDRDGYDRNGYNIDGDHRKKIV